MVALAVPRHEQGDAVTEPMSHTDVLTMHDFLRKALDPRCELDRAAIESLLLPTPTREGLHLDYKRGEWLDEEPRTAAARVRKWVTSFANSDGGALVVGVADERAQGDGVPPWTITGCRPPKKGSLFDWASDAVRDLGVLHPVVHVVSTPGASYGPEVLIIAAARFHRLIPCVESGSQVYYVRLGASTVRADDWLLRDLFLTRRARPHIIPTTRATNYDGEGGHLDQRYSFEAVISLENASPVWASGLHVTALGLWEGGGEISDSAHAGVHVATHGLGLLSQSVPHAASDPPPWDLPPFGRLDLRFRARVLDDPLVRGEWIVCGAVLVTSRDDLPRWMQLVLRGSTSQRGLSAEIRCVEDGNKPLVFAGSLDELFDSGADAYLPEEILDHVM